MATASDTTTTTPKRAKAPAARTRKAATKANGAARPAVKRPARKPAAPNSVTEQVSARIAAAERSVAETATGAVAAIRDKAHVPQAAKTAVAKVRRAVTPKKTPARKAPARRGAASSKGVSTGAVIGVAAAGLAAGIVANIGRKAAVQAPSVMAGDWMAALKAEHKAALALIDRLAKSTPEQPAKRTLLLTQLKHALGKHAFTEENVIYPALREWGDKADADALNHEQGYQKQYLYELDNMDKSSPEFAQKVADFRADLNAHIREEEDKIFPKIHAGLDDDKNKALTAAANREGFKLA